jgi:hypothetical protein
VIHADRLNKKYFRRWFYWRGVSRAIMYQQHGLDMENPQARGTDFSKAWHLGGIPRYLFRSMARTATNLVKAAIRRDETAAFEHELVLCMYAGIAKQRWRDRREPFPWANGRVTNISPEPASPSA